jgi:hypothetical protein
MLWSIRFFGTIKMIEKLREEREIIRQTKSAYSREYNLLSNRIIGYEKRLNELE